MLHGQIGKAKGRKREASIGFDIKLLKGDIKESRDIDDSISVKLSETIKQLDDAGLIGTLRSQRHPFIRASCDMIWATYGWGESNITFWGYQRGPLLLALAGSKFHVLGEQRVGTAFSHSLTGAIQSWIYTNIAEPFPKGTIASTKEAGWGLLRDSDIANGMWLGVTQARGEQNKFEFVAKVLHRSNWPNGFRGSPTKRIILASPLYVALAA